RRGGAIDRRILGVRRLFDGRWLPCRGQHRRTQFAWARLLRQSGGAVWTIYPWRAAVVRRSLFPRVPSRVRYRPFCQTAEVDELRLVHDQHDGLWYAARLCLARGPRPAGALFAVSPGNLAAKPAAELQQYQPGWGDHIPHAGSGVSLPD